MTASSLPFLFSLTVLLTPILLTPACSRREEGTLLRRDLIELDQSLRAGISQGQGLHQAERIAENVEHLERDYRLEQAHLNADQRLIIEANLNAGQYLLQAAALFAPYASYDIDHKQGIPHDRWVALQAAYNLITGTNQVSMPAQGDILLTKSSPAP